MGDAVLNADTGSPQVVRIGEKGNVWVELEATGVANHAAHAHLGRNAVDTLVDALGAVRGLEDLSALLPEVVERTIAEAKVVSEAESGEREAETLRRITVNIGFIEGGTGVNTIPDRARALCDIRIPPGVTVDRVRAELAAAIDSRFPTCRGGSSPARSRAGPIRRRRCRASGARECRPPSPGATWW